MHGVLIMTVCYNKLWRLLIDKNMKKKDLRLATGMSTTALAKLGKNEHVSTKILVKICKALDCDLCDIIELVKEENQNSHSSKNKQDQEANNTEAKKA